MPKKRGNRSGSSGGQPAGKYHGGGLSPEDAALWKAFAQNIQAANVKQRVQEAEAESFRDMLRAERKARSVPQPHPGKPAKSDTPDAKPGRPVRANANGAKHALAEGQGSSAAIDPRSVRKIGAGRTTVDARIDLHGMRQHEAHSALSAFLHRSVANGHRFVLVITGKGTAERGQAWGDIDTGPMAERGVLRRKVPQWLDRPELRSIVVGYTIAHIRHGGEGALYVQLRRRR